MSTTGTLETDAQPRPRRSIDARTNLSSNELNHPALPALLRRLVTGFDPATLRCYPEQHLAVTAAAELLDVASTEGLVLGAGSDSLLRLLQSECWDDTGGRLILQWPNYEAWSVSRGLSRWQVTRVPTPGGLVAERMLPHIKAASPSTVVLSWPNGPAGYCPGLAEVELLRDACAERGHLLVVDGCYSAFARPEALQDLVRLAGPHCLVLLSWSKMFGLAGGRLAVAVGDFTLTRRLRLHRQEDHVNVLMLHVLRRTSALLPEYHEVWRDIATAREQIRVRLAVNAGVVVPRSGGNFLHVPMPSAAAAASLTRNLDAAGYRVRNMQDVTDLVDHVRFTVTVGQTADAFLETLISLLVAERRP